MSEVVVPRYNTERSNGERIDIAPMGGVVQLFDEELVCQEEEEEEEKKMRDESPEIDSSRELSMRDRLLANLSSPFYVPEEEEKEIDEEEEQTIDALA